ncbi:MAG: hypothetical protein LBD04_05405 [Synergistaceae bacterium]|jgi:hypothetical protein|nr:hypothetical protein [Synergistaceae bacterium]
MTNRYSEREWPTPGPFQAALFGVFVLAFWLIILRSKDGYVFILDTFNLLIHEAGHVFFWPFGHTLWYMGGSLLQCIVPAAFCLSFRRTRQPAGFAVSGLWLGENFLSVSRYISDAQAMAMPLLGGGDHDWNTLLGGTFLLRYCRALGGIVALLGWVVMVAFAVWYEMLYWRGRDNRRP